MGFHYILNPPRIIFLFFEIQKFNINGSLGIICDYLMGLPKQDP